MLVIVCNLPKNENQHLIEVIPLNEEILSSKTTYFVKFSASPENGEEFLDQSVGTSYFLTPVPEYSLSS